MKKLIYTDENRLKLQTDYNIDFATAVNASIEQLENICGKLTDEQIKMFLKNPSELANELVSLSRKEYDAYVAKFPKSVQVSMQFSDNGLPDAVKAIHKALMAQKPHQMIDRTTIKGGVCKLDEAGLKALADECSIFGSENAAKVWELSVKAAKALNELKAAIKGNAAFAESVESWGRWQGFVTFSEGVYFPNPNILNTLEGEKE